MHTATILIASAVYDPSVGGVETIARLLLRALEDKGFTVTVATLTPSDQPEETTPNICRSPSPVRTFLSVYKSDCVILMGPTLRLGWPLLFLRRKCLIRHQILPDETSSFITKKLRKILQQRSANSACSQQLAAQIGQCCQVIPNPFDDKLFRVLPNVKRRREILFIGRLIPEKGLPVLIEALKLLINDGLRLFLTVVGDGPQRRMLEDLVCCNGLADEVDFVGQVVGERLVEILNSHHVVVVPSVWEEPFGIVALEAIACGCAVVASNAGGLPDAIGQCGLTFERANVEDLARTLRPLLVNPLAINELQRRATEHLSRYMPAVIGLQYIRNSNLTSGAGSESSS